MQITKLYLTLSRFHFQSKLLNMVAV